MNDDAKENGDDEMIVLDAQLTTVICDKAFYAVLRNGHVITAFLRAAGAVPLEPGQSVKVRMSPFDMSRGEILELFAPVVGCGA